ncbi:hypothetical protein JR316_0009449 [Psilocybe cubensis]|nr:hypothetical protein JR316_0009449 [Psilocybe cubensis]KAH9478986.1 hypothetical protein JR316_0009449 [Psilocybe cubensis]
MWMGMISYQIATVIVKQQGVEGYNNLSIPCWQDVLLKNCCDTAWLESFLESEIFRYHGTQRVGLFVDIEGSQYSDIRRQPPVEWFSNYSVPVWYIWKPEYNADKRYQHLAPLPHQLQEAAASVIPSEPQLSPDFQLQEDIHDAEPIAREVVLSENHPIDDSSWQLFFTQREQRNKRTAATETSTERELREKRAEMPPQSAKVFVWEENESGVLVREPVGPKERANVLTRFSEEQIRYDPFSNEYDCSEHFGPIITGFFEADYIEGGEEPDLDVPENELQTVSATLLNSCEPPSSLTISSLASEGDTDWIPRNCLLKDLLVEDNAAAEILDVLRIHFGYTPPLILESSSAPHHVLSVAMQRNFLKIIGINGRSCPAGVFQRPAIVAAVGFMRRLCLACREPTIIAEDEWDLNPMHRNSLATSSRISCIQRVQKTSHERERPSKSPQGPSPKHRSDDHLYMFNFGVQGAMDWKLAVTTAADAAIVCRLPENYNQAEIALFLLQRGIPFHTLKPWPAHISVDCHDRKAHRIIDFQHVIGIPSRPPKYVFDTTDYALYVERASQLLRDTKIGRAALMQGGYVWRIAVPIVSFDAVLQGPVLEPSGEYLLVRTQDGDSYFDNELDAWTIDTLSGLYHCYTGESDQIAKKSWYPLANTQEHSGHDHGRWTAISEEIYNLFTSRNSFAYISEAMDNAPQVQHQPKSANKWRDATRGIGDLRRAKLQLEQASKDMISKVQRVF